METAIVEDKIVNIILSNEHVFLLIGIVGIIYILKQITPISNFVFSEKWKWMVALINLGLSFVGIFVLKLTTLTTLGMKVIMAVTIAGLATAAYEWLIKYLDNMIRAKFGQPPAPPAPPASPVTP